MAPIEVSRVRLRCVKYVEKPVIRKLAVYATTPK